MEFETQIQLWTLASNQKQAVFPRLNISYIQNSNFKTNLRVYLENSLQIKSVTERRPYFNLVNQLRSKGKIDFGTVIDILKQLSHDEYIMGLRLIKFALERAGLKLSLENIDFQATAYFDDDLNYEDYGLGTEPPKDLFSFIKYARVNLIKARSVSVSERQLQVDEFTSNEPSFILTYLSNETLKVFQDLFVKLFDTSADQKSEDQVVDKRFLLNIRSPRDFDVQRFSFENPEQYTKMLVYTMARSLLMTQINTNSAASQPMIWLLAALTVFRTQFFYYRDDKTLPVFPLFPILRAPPQREAAFEQRFAAHGTEIRPLLVSFPRWWKLASLTFEATDATPKVVELKIAYASPSFYSEKAGEYYTVTTIVGKFLSPKQRSGKPSSLLLVFEAEISFLSKHGICFLDPRKKHDLKQPEPWPVQEFCKEYKLVDPKENLKLPDKGPPTGSNVVVSEVQSNFDLRGTGFKRQNTTVRLEHAPVAVYIPLENPSSPQWLDFFREMTILINAENQRKLLKVSLSLIYHTTGFSGNSKEFLEFMRLIDDKMRGEDPAWPELIDLSNMFDYIQTRQKYIVGHEVQSEFKYGTNKWDFFICEGTLETSDELQFEIDGKYQSYKNRLTALTLNLDVYPVIKLPKSASPASKRLAKEVAQQKHGLPSFFSPTLLSGVRITANENQIRFYCDEIESTFYQLEGKKREIMQAYAEAYKKYYEGSENYKFTADIERPEHYDLHELIPVFKFWFYNRTFVKNNTRLVLLQKDGIVTPSRVSYSEWIKNERRPYKYEEQVPDDVSVIGPENNKSIRAFNNRVTFLFCLKRLKEVCKDTDEREPRTIYPNLDTIFMKWVRFQEFRGDDSIQKSNKEYFGGPLLSCFQAKGFWKISRHLNFVDKVLQINERTWTEMILLNNDGQIDDFGFLTLRRGRLIDQIPFVKNNGNVCALLQQFKGQQENHFQYGNIELKPTRKKFYPPQSPSQSKQVLSSSDSEEDPGGSKETEPEDIVDEIIDNLVEVLQEYFGGTSDFDTQVTPVFTGFCKNWNSSSIVSKEQLEYLYPLIHSQLRYFKDSPENSSAAYDRIEKELADNFASERFLPYVLYGVCIDAYPKWNHIKVTEELIGKIYDSFTKDQTQNKKQKTNDADSSEKDSSEEDSPVQDVVNDEGVDDDGKYIDSLSKLKSKAGLRMLLQPNGRQLPVFNLLQTQEPPYLDIPTATILAQRWQYSLLYKARVDHLLDVIQKLAIQIGSKPQMGAKITIQGIDAEDNDGVFKAHQIRCASLSKYLYGTVLPDTSLDPMIFKINPENFLSGTPETVKNKICEGKLFYDQRLRDNLTTKNEMSLYHFSELYRQVHKFNIDVDSYDADEPEETEPRQEPTNVNMDKYKGTKVLGFTVLSNGTVEATIQRDTAIQKENLDRRMLLAKNFFRVGAELLDENTNRKKNQSSPYFMWLEECRLAHLKNSTDNLIASFYYDVVNALNLRKSHGYRIVTELDSSGVDTQQSGQDGPDSTKTKDSFGDEDLVTIESTFYDLLNPVFEHYSAIFDFTSMCSASISILKMWIEEFGYTEEEVQDTEETNELGSGHSGEEQAVEEIEGEEQVVEEIEGDIFYGRKDVQIAVSALTGTNFEQDQSYTTKKDKTDFTLKVSRIGVGGTVTQYSVIPNTFDEDVRVEFWPTSEDNQGEKSVDDDVIDIDIEKRPFVLQYQNSIPHIALETKILNGGSGFNQNDELHVGTDLDSLTGIVRHLINVNTLKRQKKNIETKIKVATEEQKAILRDELQTIETEIENEDLEDNKEEFIPQIKGFIESEYSRENLSNDVVFERVLRNAQQLVANKISILQEEAEDFVFKNREIDTVRDEVIRKLIYFMENQESRSPQVITLRVTEVGDKGTIKAVEFMDEARASNELVRLGDSPSLNEQGNSDSSKTPLESDPLKLKRYRSPEGSPSQNQQSKRAARTQFNEIRIEGDGNCLWRSVAYLVYGDQRQHETVKNSYVTFLNKIEHEHKDSFEYGFSQKISITDAEFWFVLQKFFSKRFEFKTRLPESNENDYNRDLYDGLKEELKQIIRRCVTDATSTDTSPYVKGCLTLLEYVYQGRGDSITIKDNGYILFSLRRHINYLEEKSNPWGTEVDQDLLLALYGLKHTRVGSFINADIARMSWEDRKALNTQWVKQDYIRGVPGYADDIGDALETQMCDVFPIVGFSYGRNEVSWDSCDYWIIFDGEHWSVKYKTTVDIPIPGAIQKPPITLEVDDVFNQTFRGQACMRGGENAQDFQQKVKNLIESLKGTPKRSRPKIVKEWLVEGGGINREDLTIIDPSDSSITHEDQEEYNKLIFGGGTAGHYSSSAFVV